MRYENQPLAELRFRVELVTGGAPVTGSTTVEIAIQRVSDGKWWNHTLVAFGVGIVWNVGAEVPATAGVYEVDTPSYGAGNFSTYAAAQAGFRIIFKDAVNNLYENLFVNIVVDPWRGLRADYAAVAGSFGEGVNTKTISAGAIAAATFATDAIDANAMAANAIGAIELATAAAAEIADAVLDEPMAGHTGVGSLGDLLRRMLALRQNNCRVVYTAWNAAGVPTGGTVYIYATKVDLDADAGGTGVGAIGSYAFGATFDASLRPTVYTSGRTS